MASFVPCHPRVAPGSLDAALVIQLQLRLRDPIIQVFTDVYNEAVRVVGSVPPDGRDVAILTLSAFQENLSLISTGTSIRFLATECENLRARFPDLVDLPQTYVSLVSRKYYHEKRNILAYRPREHQCAFVAFIQSLLKLVAQKFYTCPVLFDSYQKPLKKMEHLMVQYFLVEAAIVEALCSHVSLDRIVSAKFGDESLPPDSGAGALAFGSRETTAAINTEAETRLKRLEALLEEQKRDTRARMEEADQAESSKKALQKQMNEMQRRAESDRAERESLRHWAEAMQASLKETQRLHQDAETRARAATSQRPVVPLTVAPLAPPAPPPLAAPPAPVSMPVPRTTSPSAPNPIPVTMPMSSSSSSSRAPMYLPAPPPPRSRYDPLRSTENVDEEVVEEDDDDEDDDKYNNKDAAAGEANEQKDRYKAYEPEPPKPQASSLLRQRSLEVEFNEDSGEADNSVARMQPSHHDPDDAS